MEAYFEKLGLRVLEEWKRVNFGLEAFPEIAVTALEEDPPSEAVDVEGFVRRFLFDDIQPSQTHSGFGQPEIVVFEHSRFYIQVLFWMEGTTAIHQHDFSGAFHVLAGSSLHARYEFFNRQPVTPHLHLGDVTLGDFELLETGRTVPIRSGRECIHSLFHLDTPSLTVVVRTQHDPGVSPQFNYYPPHLAWDPVHSDALMVRRNQLLDVLEQTGDLSYPELAMEMLDELDFERGFLVLQHGMSSFQNLDAWEDALTIFRNKHGDAADAIALSLEENLRREILKEFRGFVTDPELRFFLALLMNFQGLEAILEVVRERHPENPPVEIILGWLEELARPTEFGVSILDAVFPMSLPVPEEEQTPLFLQAWRAVLEDETPEDMDCGVFSEIEAAIERSTLRVLATK